MALTPAQMAALRERFGSVLDVEREVRNALDYAANFHRGRPYKNLGRMVWNWLLRSERQRRCWGVQRPAAEAAVQGVAQRALRREQLEALLNDEVACIREMAAEELRILDAEAAKAQDSRTSG